MFMKTSGLAKNWRNIVGIVKIQALENNVVNDFIGRLSREGKIRGKMKVYPGMLLKIKDRFLPSWPERECV